MKLIVAGGRDFKDYNTLRAKLDFLLKKVTEPIIIISGKADGADRMGEDYAEERGYAVEEFPANWNDLTVTPCVIRYRNGKPYNAAAGGIRNQQMAEAATHAVIFWDGKSSGTEDMIKRSTKEGLILKVYRYE